MRFLGLDPGLQRTGWGVIEFDSGKLRHIADGVVKSNADLPMAERLRQLHEGVAEVVATYQPEEAAIEKVFVNRNPESTLKLGQARGAIMLAPAFSDVPVFEYSPNEIKKAVVGAGHAAKEQVDMMLGVLMKGCKPSGADAADALAVAVCHAHERSTGRKLMQALIKGNGA